MGWKTFNDRLAIILLVMILVLWVLQPLCKFALPDAVNGALIVAFTLILQYYFRKAPADPTTTTTTTTTTPTPVTPTQAAPPASPPGGGGQ